MQVKYLLIEEQISAQLFKIVPLVVSNSLLGGAVTDVVIAADADQWHLNILEYFHEVSLLILPDVGPLVWHGVNQVAAYNEKGGLGLHRVHLVNGYPTQLYFPLPTNVRVLVANGSVTIVDYHTLKVTVGLWKHFRVPFCLM